MDSEIVGQKLESLRRCLQSIETKCPADAALLAADIDIDLQDIVALNLTRAVQLTVDIGAHIIAGKGVPTPETMGQTFELLAQAGLIDADLAGNLKQAVGFRIAIHNYEKINWTIVHSIIRKHLVDFARFAKATAVLIETGGPQ